MKKDLTEMVFILDRSGSMAGMEKDTIGGYNATVDRNRDDEGDVTVLRPLAYCAEADLANVKQ